MIINNVELEHVAVRPEQYPANRMPEIAFAGKSNVGKSSLINTMINRKALARTSQTPGKTRTINFYNVEDMVYFVDLPGYGFAKAPANEVRKWGKMIEKYLTERKELCAIIMLVDIRHKPGENDIQMYEWLKYYGYDIIIAATKHDKLKRSQVKDAVSTIRKAFNVGENDVLIPFSSETNEGRQELWDIIMGKVEAYNEG
ncbi:ribosome biogenesis GTP-binding protein YihA/YsxC [Tyzzerella sp. OttesenSCG-928-J15]|nr:ribosome biogenesis GTP-binding protein YihA/YsxC [Tyzzerella sp. OttesenSCG-928-J15]